MNSEFLSEAIALAKEAAENGEVPVGAVVVKNGKIIGRGRNMREQNRDVFAHAECIAIKNAANSIGDWRLDGCEIYVTLEPCPMCAGAILNSRIKTVVFGAYDTNFGAATNESKVNIFGARYPNSPQVFGGIYEEPCKELLTEFFKKKREQAMNLIVCTDKSGGIMFNNRRVSRDSAVIDKIAEILDGAPLYLTEYSAKLFENTEISVNTDISAAKAGAFIFYEDNELPAEINKIYLFNWNRDYPADKFFELPMDFRWIKKSDFAGSSHKKISLEVYVRKIYE